ncbi:MAG: ribosome-binding factor A [Candidatus Paceibacterota bacterium]|jgi:ribosome-binding factor A
MKSLRQEKVSEVMRHLAAEYLGQESNKTALITVTRCDVSPDLKRGTIFLTVFPENKEETVLDFARRHRAEMRDFLKKRLTTKNIPFLEVEIDRGEKNRQHIDELLRESK